MRGLLLVGLLAAVACRGTTEPPLATPATSEGVSLVEATQHDRWGLVRVLSSDELAGRKPGTASAARARALIREALERCDYEVIEQRTSGPGINLIATQRGLPDRSRRVLVSAHYDHLGVVDGQVMNGADDNAAAVGTVVELACRISKIETSYAAGAGGPTRHAGLLIALWDTEEPPFFLTPDMGSAYFVAHPTVALESIDVTIVLDLVGHGLWPGFPAHVVLGAETSSEVERAVVATPAPGGLDIVQASLHLVEAIVATGQRQSWSDYHGFREAGVPILFLSNGQSHHYHRPSDDFDTLDLTKLGLQTDWLVALVERLLTNAQKPRFEARDSRPELDAAAARRLVEGALAHIEEGGAGAGHFDGPALEADLERLTTDTSPTSLRRAVQRIQCFAARSYPKRVCVGL